MVLVDPGSDVPARSRNCSRRSTLTQDCRLKMIVLTHHHLDHVAVFAAVRARYRVPVAATEPPVTCRRTWRSRMASAFR